MGAITQAMAAEARARGVQIELEAPVARVLVTDGAANCMAGTDGQDVFTRYDDDLEPLVRDAFMHHDEVVVKMTDNGCPVHQVDIVRFRQRCRFGRCSRHSRVGRACHAPHA